MMKAGKPVLVGFSALLLAAGIAACGDTDTRDEVRESVGAAVEDAAGTVESRVETTVETKGEEVRGTLEARGDEVGGTIEARGDELKPTIEAAADEVEGAVEGLGFVSDELDGWTEAVLTALGTLGAQSSALSDDDGLIADSAWQEETQDAIGELSQRAEDAINVADDLEADDRLPRIRSALADAGASLGESADTLATHVEDEDAEAFMEATESLALLTTAVEALERLVDTIGER